MGVAAHPPVTIGLQKPPGHPARGAGGARVVDDYLVIWVKDFKPFLGAADAHGARDVPGEILPLSQGHDELEVVSPVEFLLQLFAVDEIRFVLLRSEEHTSELQSRQYLVCRLLLE